jgi:hypothetical protein
VQIGLYFWRINTLCISYVLRNVTYLQSKEAHPKCFLVLRKDTPPLSLSVSLGYIPNTFSLVYTHIYLICKTSTETANKKKSLLIQQFTIHTLPYYASVLTLSCNLCQSISSYCIPTHFLTNLSAAIASVCGSLIQNNMKTHVF